MTDTTITVRVSSGLKQRLESISGSTRRSKSFLANEAIERYVESEEAAIEGIRAGLEDMRAGRLVPHEQAMARLRKSASRPPQRRA